MYGKSTLVDMSQFNMNCCRSYKAYAIETVECDVKLWKEYIVFKLISNCDVKGHLTSSLLSGYNMFSILPHITFITVSIIHTTLSAVLVLPTELKWYDMLGMQIDLQMHRRINMLVQN